MINSSATLAVTPIPREVEDFAVKKGIRSYLAAVIEVARHAFPSSALHLSVGQDVEDETHRYIALDVAVGEQTTEELLAGQRAWSAGIGGVCPSRHAVYFVLGWQ